MAGPIPAAFPPANGGNAMARNGDGARIVARWRSAVAAFALALPFLPGTAMAQALPQSRPEAQGFSAARLQRLHEFLAESTGANGYLGGVLLLARDGRIVDWQAYGHRDLARSSPLRRDAIFRLYSMSKPIASVAALQLMEQGRLGLDDQVSRYLPEFADMRVFAGGTADAPQTAPARKPITIRQLFTHTAGFAAGGAGFEEATRLRERMGLHASPDLRSFVSRLAQAPLAAEPGTRFKYDGANTEVLARLVEVVSGERFDDYLRRHLFEPLRMRDTGFSVPASQRGRIVDITRMGGDGRLVLDDGVSARHPGEALNPYSSGAGGLYSTAGDYARFCQMLLNGGSLDGADILGRKTVELMMANQLVGQLDPPVTEFSAGEGFGLGGAVVLDPGARGRLGSVGAFGWSGAASTYFTIDRRERLVAILLLQHLPNGADNDLPRLATPFYNLVYQALEK
jgi:CubicO group peptidase (beta-lactamase class C family)